MVIPKPIKQTTTNSKETKQLPKRAQLRDRAPYTIIYYVLYAVLLYTMCYILYNLYPILQCTPYTIYFIHYIDDRLDETRLDWMRNNSPRAQLRPRAPRPRRCAPPWPDEDWRQTYNNDGDE